MARLDHLKALIVDDNTHMRALLRALLQSLGIQNLFDAPDGASGFRELCERKPDVVFTDLSMTPIDGIEFTRMVRTRRESPNPFVPIIMVTGHTERQRVMSARDAGVTEFLAKPITAQNILLRLTEIIERPRAFVRCEDYFGPDRRRKKDEKFSGPWRRRGDGNVEAI
jgi:two-component system, chemotaxis family, chemotaxis protein CheY